MSRLAIGLLLMLFAVPAAEAPQIVRTGNATATGACKVVGTPNAAHMTSSDAPAGPPALCRDLGPRSGGTESQDTKMLQGHHGSEKGQGPAPEKVLSGSTILSHHSPQLRATWSGVGHHPPAVRLRPPRRVHASAVVLLAPAAGVPRGPPSPTAARQLPARPLSVTSGVLLYCRQSRGIADLAGNLHESQQRSS